MRPPADPSAEPRRPASSRERVAQLRAARVRERRSRSSYRLRILGLAAVALVALLALAPVLRRLYAPQPAAVAQGALPRAALAALAADATPAAPGPAASPTPARAPYAGPTASPGSIARVPILMYHYVRSVDQAADPLGYGLSVTPAAFAAQLDWLARAGYATLRMDEAVACLQGAGGCPPKAVAITFDDGYMDAYTEAMPLLRERGMVATFYIVGGFVGQPGYMGEPELRAMHAAGMDLGAHSLAHLDLTTLPAADAQGEIAGSRDRVAAIVGAPVTSFCYPAGRYSAEVRAMVAQAGYTSAVTTEPADAASDFGDPLLLPRLRVDGATDLQGFGWLVESVIPPAP